MTDHEPVRITITDVHPAMPSLLKRSNDDITILGDRRWVEGYLLGWQDRGEAEEPER